jgi:hypothetical protein
VWRAIHGHSPELWHEPPAAFDVEPDSDEEPEIVEA